MEGEVRQFFIVDFVQRTDRMNSSVPRLHRVPRELGESGLVLDQPIRLCLATRSVWASSLLLSQATFNERTCKLFLSLDLAAIAGGNLTDVDA